jgi:hypothetical protein
MLAKHGIKVLRQHNAVRDGALEDLALESAAFGAALAPSRSARKQDE